MDKPRSSASVRSLRGFAFTATVPVRKEAGPQPVPRPAAPAPQATPVAPLPPPPNLMLHAEAVRHAIRALGITENLIIHQQDYNQFLHERGLTELGRGGEGAVYFLRGHVVKLSEHQTVPSLLREIAHMLQLNRHVVRGVMGERARDDFPSLLWIYVLSNGAVSIGMKPFDLHEDETTAGSTLHERLAVGPVLGRAHVRGVLRGLAESLAHCHANGIIHHDLKPANIYIPSRATQRPVLFDFGQALWQQSSWGRKWLLHPHNQLYWYNGTYRYMHKERRLAHLAALAKAGFGTATPEQLAAFDRYVPSYYDDILAYARILRDFVTSRFSGLVPAEQQQLREFYQRLMRFGAPRKPVEEPSGFFSRLFGAKKAAPVEDPWGDPKAATMSTILPDIEKLTERLGK